MKTFLDYGIETGSRTGQIKTLCPQCSPLRKKSKTPCLAVNTEKGVWICWHCDWKGNLKGGEENKSYPNRWVPKKYSKPFFKLIELPAKVIEWFKTRGISQKVLQRNKIGFGSVYMPQVEKEVDAIQFPYYRNDEVINIKYRDGNKNFRMSGGAERLLYGLDDCTGDTALIVEGEMDKLACEEAGFIHVLSVPDGAPSLNTKNYETKFDYLESAAPLIEKLKKIILAGDSDGPGVKLQEELARRIGKERCKKVEWPEGCKDANEVLIKHGTAKVKECIDNAHSYPVKGIFELSDIADRITKLYREGYQRGEHPGWGKLSQYYTVRPGEWTLVTGIPSHGKSEFVDALIMNLGKLHGWRFGIYSPENQPLERHAAKLIEKYKGMPFSEGSRLRMSESDMAACIDLLQDYFNFILPGYDDDHSIDAVLDLAKVLIFRKGIKGLVIDPWNELDHCRPPGLTETEYISQALSKIRRFARLNSLHIWVVAHPTKLQKNSSGNYPVPTPYDVSGSAHWRNKADNALSIWRDLENPSSPVQIHIQKIRFKEVGKIGMVELNYEYATGRYSDVS